jgi:hypothetical protein
MDDGMPRDASGLRPCEWCGGPIRQPATGRRRRYCKAGHREMAYRARKNDDRVTDALQWDEETARTWLVTHGAPPPSDSSVDETRGIRIPSVDETRRVRSAFGRRRSGMTAAAMPVFQEPEE